MSAQIIYPPDAFPFFDPVPSPSSSLPNVALTPGFFSLPSLSNEPWPPSTELPSPPPIPWTFINPDTDQQPQDTKQYLQTVPAIQPRPSIHDSNPQFKSKPNPESQPKPPLNTPLDIHLKRENFLARNRKAALKCRQKRKQRHEALANQYEEVSRRKRALQSEAEALRTEVLQLKDELLRHSLCGDESIRGHLKMMVRQVTRRGVAATSGSGYRPGSESGSVSGSGSCASPTADSPLLQEGMERERRRIGGQVKREDPFDDLVNLG